MDTIREPARDIPVVAEAESCCRRRIRRRVRGGSRGPKRRGDPPPGRYGYLGGDATGSMVIVLDDMTDGKQITVGGLVQETSTAWTRWAPRCIPPEEDRYVPTRTLGRSGRTGASWTCTPV